MKKQVLGALAVLGFVLSACTTGSAGTDGTTPGPTTSGGAVTQTVTTGSSPAPSSTAPTSSTPTPTPKPNKKVHLSTGEADGSVWGVAQPLVVIAKPAPTDSTDFTKNVTVTVNGQPASGYWFWEESNNVAGAFEAHYRPQHYWPAHADIVATFNLAGKSAGKGLEYDGKLTSLSIKTGDFHRSVVDAGAREMTVYDDNKVVKKVPVSLGAAKTPTFNGTKVVMQKGEANPGSDTNRKNGAVRMQGPGYDEIVDWSVRVTSSGEYVHAAPWNSRIGSVSTSNGCTNLSVADAKWFYDFSQLGDPVEYIGTDGGKMPSWDGYGDWNLPWPTWQKGGELLNH